MNKIAVILTNVDHYGNDEEKTGLWLSEATEFVNTVIPKGIDVDYISPKGGVVPLDPRSLGKLYVKKEDKRLWESKDFQERALKNSLCADTVNPSEYLGIYYTGGHGVLWDFPENKQLQRLAWEIYKNGGYVMSVCHGVCGLLNITDDKGTPLIKGRKITGFTKEEEILSGKYKKVPFITETEIKKKEAVFCKKFPFRRYAIHDNRFITGQNPMSGGEVAKVFLDVLENRGF